MVSVRIQPATRTSQNADVAARWGPGFVLLSAIWGSSFALIKVAVDAGVAPMWVALWRCLFGTLALLAGCALSRSRLPRDPATWGHAAILALLLNVVPFSLLSFGEQRISSVLAGVFNATTPLATLLFGLVLVPSERLTGWRVLGLVSGFAGVACLLEVWHGFGGPAGVTGGAAVGGAGVAGSASGGMASGGAPVGGLACAGAALCYGAGFSWTRRWYSGRDGSAVPLSALQIGCAVVELALVTPWLSGPPRWPGWGAAAALLVLGAVGTGMAYILNLRVIRAAGSGVAATVTYLAPVWSTAIGALLLAEPIDWPILAGAALIAAGILAIRRR
jgi:drug/metabolite transporter (DMT)-like permease